jgi:hypothetical protein
MNGAVNSRRMLWLVASWIRQASELPGWVP